MSTFPNALLKSGGNCINGQTRQSPHTKEKTPVWLRARWLVPRVGGESPRRAPLPLSQGFLEPQRCLSLAACSRLPLHRCLSVQRPLTASVAIIAPRNVIVCQIRQGRASDTGVHSPGSGEFILGYIAPRPIVRFPPSILGLTNGGGNLSQGPLTSCSESFSTLHRGLPPQMGTAQFAVYLLQA